MDKFVIELSNLKFFAYHGIYEHERRDGQDFEVNLTVTIDCADEKDIDCDSLGSTISYAALFDIIDEEMIIPRQLLETVCYSIAKKIRANNPLASAISCKIIKLNPPIPGCNGSASVCYKWEAEK